MYFCSRKYQRYGIKKAKKVVSDIPEGYMSLEQFEKELVEAVVKKL